jgi:hypothetical protein
MEAENARFSTEQAMIVLKEAVVHLESVKKSQNVEAKYHCLKMSLITLYKKRGLYQEVLTLVAPEEVAKYCDELSVYDASVWREGLKLTVASLTSVKGENERKSASKIIVGGLLERILGRKVMTITSILPFFSRSTICTFDLLCDDVLEELKALDAAVRLREEELKQCDEELAKMKSGDVVLGADLVCVKAKVCWLCKAKISQPCRYFMCGHVYHMKCLVGDGDVCPDCREKHGECAARKQKMIEEVRAEPDVLRVLVGVEDVDEGFQRVLGGGYFWPEAEIESQQEIKEFRARLDGTSGVE